MAFLESRMDVRIERLARGGPLNKGRTKVYTAAGYLSQIFLTSAALRQWDVSHGLRSLEDYEALRALWMVVNFTPYEGFRFRDPTDYLGSKTNTSLLNTSGSYWQLRRKYTSAAVTVYRNIKKPTSDVQIYTSGDTLCTFTLDTTTGIANVTAGTPSYWVGSFDVPVTFMGDELNVEVETSPDGLPMIITQPIRVEELLL